MNIHLNTELFKVMTEDEVYANLQTPRKIHDEDYYESVDTPLVERQKNWFQRQISRMGSVRSASTAYSSGGLFGRNRHNSVVPPHKMSLYERLVGRKSGRGQYRKKSRHGGEKNNDTANRIDQGGQPSLLTYHIRTCGNWASSWHTRTTKAGCQFSAF